MCSAAFVDGPICQLGRPILPIRLLGMFPMFQPEVLSPRESSIHPEPPLLHLGMSSYLQIAPAQHEIESHTAGDAVKGGNPAAVVERPSSPPIITFTRFGRYLGTAPEGIRFVRPYLSDHCGALDDRVLYRQMRRPSWQMGKRCRTHTSSWQRSQERCMFGYYGDVTQRLL
jgi:hypothetical protein